MKRVIGTAVEHDQALPMRAVKTAPPDWVVGYYLEAVERVKAGSLDLSTARGISGPLAEALMWLDVLRQTKRNVGRGQEIAAELARDPVTRAITFVRGRVHHHWASAVDPDRENGRWVWVRAANLPLPSEKGYLDPEGEELYIEFLEGRPVLDVLETVAARITALI